MPAVWTSCICLDGVHILATGAAPHIQLDSMPLFAIFKSLQVSRAQRPHTSRQRNNLGRSPRPPAAISDGAIAPIVAAPRKFPTSCPDARPGLAEPRPFPRPEASNAREADAYPMAPLPTLDKREISRRLAYVLLLCHLLTSDCGITARPARRCWGL